MEVFRLSRKKYASSLNGIGASIRGGRWNSKGVQMIYTAANRALAMAEVAVHFTYATLADDYMMLIIRVPDTSMGSIEAKHLPKDWNSFPHKSKTQNVGDRFIVEGKHLLLKVPSVVVYGEYNYLINPNHPDFKKIKVTDADKFPFDRRLFKS